MPDPVADYVLGQLQILRDIFANSHMSILDFMQSTRFTSWIEEFKMGLNRVVQTHNPTQSAQMGGVTYDAVYAALSGWRH